MSKVTKYVIEKGRLALGSKVYETGETVELTEKQEKLLEGLQMLGDSIVKFSGKSPKVETPKVSDKKSEVEEKKLEVAVPKSE